MGERRMKVFPETTRLIWYAVCDPDPEDDSKKFVIGYETERNQTGYGYADHIVFDFYKTEQYKELEKKYPNIRCYTTCRSDNHLWQKLVGHTPEEVWHICQFVNEPPFKVLLALLSRELYRMQRDALEEWTREHDGEELGEDEEISTPMDWLEEKDARRAVADVLSQAMWAWYRYPESERQRAVDRGVEFETFKMFYDHRMMDTEFTAMYLFPKKEKMKYVGFVERDLVAEEKERREHVAGTTAPDDEEAKE